MFGINGLTAIWRGNAEAAEEEFWGNLDKSKREGIPIKMWRATRKALEDSESD
ncbi:MAG: hypothetical protein JHC70_23850 [Rhodococcus sp.]|nr:hypothetical protein [Rhodococcus sp. (in: high G+C Gram-positive bacteria)]MBJ7325362.1 hypothetical protein [Rhodococcus sp. (in: high G+C Gram-positive bacteria)]